MLTFFSCLFCFALCYWELKKSYENAKQGIVDNGAQHAITYGVFFTFLGIAWGLWSFDTGNISHSINDFLRGMQTTFFTSIIGTFFAWIISRFVQNDVEIKKDYQMSFEMHQLQGIQKLISVERGIEALTNQIGYLIHSSPKEILQSEADKHRSEEHTVLLRAIDSLQKSVENSSSTVLARAAGSFTDSIQEYISTVKSTGGNMASLSKSINDQIMAFQRLDESIREANKKQQDRLEMMDQSIKEMAQFMEKSYENSGQMMTEARTYQAASLENEKHEIQILGENTERICEMKTAFNQFLEDMAEQNNKKFIEALNESMKDLNTKLTEQFGENFKELNAAVKDLVSWQDQYKSIVEKTTEELKTISGTFKQFTQEVVPQVNEQTAKMNENLALFSSSTKESIEIQREMASTTSLVSSALEQNQETARSLESFNKTLMEETHAALSAHQENFANFTSTLAGSLDEASRQSVELSVNTADILRKFNEASDNLLRGISNTLEQFDGDFRNELQNAMQTLSGDMAQIAKATGEVTGKQVKELAGALGKISRRMTDNYTALVEKIGEVDKLLNKRQGRG